MASDTFEKYAGISSGQTAINGGSVSKIAGIAVPFLPVVAAVVVLAIHSLLPSRETPAMNIIYDSFIWWLIGVGILVAFAPVPSLQVKARNIAPLLCAGIAALAVWEVATSKYALLPLPYFPGPDKVLTALVEDWKLIGTSLLYSLRMLLTGYLVGTAAGLVTGVLMGWSRGWHYWISPIMKVIGPIPATAWIPLAMVVFPTSFLASTFLVALAVWFPVTVMTGSGIANVRNSYFEVARTLGASERFLVLRVAIPAAFPTIFVGLFMGLGASFLVLIVAEMIGVKAGLGWYISWTQGWAEYAKVYACIIVIALVFSGIIALLFKLRDKVLVWQQGVIKW